ncbi:MAG: diacylglycerol kinase family lipid kinase [Planctomycetota bacterium]|nr:diacylglycerol kinase family lipid kinase [Planctomycetota bacterium]
MKKVLLIVNPIAGSRRAAMKSAARISTALKDANYSVEMFETRRRNDAFQRAKEENVREFVAVCVLGGDGTLNEVINGVSEKKIPVLPVPLGLSNVLAKEIGASTDSSSVVETLKTGSSVEIDLLEATFITEKSTEKKKRVFAAMAGVGFDADVVTRIARSRRKGLGFAGYVPSIVKSLFSPSHPFIVSADGKRLTENATYLVVGNGTYYGGPFHITTKASMTDGKMDVLYGERFSSLEVIMFYGSVLCRSHLRHRGIRHLQCKTLEVDIKEGDGASVHIDGEAVGRIPLSIRVIPRGLRLLVPKRK